MQISSATPSFWATVIWIVLGAVFFGAAMERFHGVLIGALFGYLLSQVIYLRQLARQLVSRLALLDSDTRRAGPPGPEEKPAAGPQRPAATVPAPAAAAPPGGSAPTLAKPPPPPPSAPTWLDHAITDAIAWLKRGNPMARVGIVVLFFGGAFLAKYSAERGLLPLEVRFMALAAGSLALLVVGWRLRARRRVFAQILQGGAIAGFYLTVFAAMRLYQLLPQEFALALLVTVALAAAVLAVAQNALALAVIGTAGGFLAPVLVSTGGGNHIALFSYYTVLNVGVFAVAWFRAWRVLNLVGFVFTFGVTSAFRALAYSQDKMVSTDFFLLLFFVLYVAVSILFSLRQKPDLKGYVSGSLVFGLPVVVFTLHATLVSRVEYALAWSALGFGAFYLALAYAVHRSGRDTLRLLAEAFAALGVIFASLAIPLAFDRQTTAAMWAVEGAGLIWLGVRQSRKLARAFGALLQLAGGIGYLAGLGALRADTAVLNSAYLGTLMLAIAGLCSGLWLYRHRAELARYEAGAGTAAGIWAVLWLLYGGLAEVDRSVPPGSDYGAALAFCAAAPLLLNLLCRRLSWPLLDRIAAVVIPLVIWVGFAAALKLHHPFAELGGAGWAAVLAVQYFFLRRLESSGDAALVGLSRWLHASGLWAVALLLAWETSWQINEQVPGVWSALPWGLAPALLLWSAAVAMPPWPVGAHATTYRTGGIPLAVFAGLWVLAINLTRDGSAGWLPYVPLFNPMDIAIAIVLVAIGYWWTALRAERPDWATSFGPGMLWAATAFVVFLWLNSALVRALHHLIGTPWDWHGIRHSFVVQASLSIFWSLLGLTAIAFAGKRANRAVWIAGAALMGLVIVKLVLIDAAGRGTLARIVSFMTVGGLLLLAGYVSPLPPSTVRKESST